MDKVLVIAAAKKEFVEACLDELDDDAEVHLWLNAASLTDYADFSGSKLCYGESFELPTVSMLLNFFRFGPTKVVMVCGTTYYHENIYSVVSFLKRLTGNKSPVFHFSLNSLHELEHARSGEAGKYGMAPFAGLMGLFLLLCGYLAYSFPLALVALLLCFVGYEVAAQPRGHRKIVSKEPVLSRDMDFDSVRENDGAVTYSGCITRTDQDGKLEFVESAVKYPWFEHGSRIVSAEPINKDKPRILLLGCSVLYGLNVDDTKTCGWLLQERFPEYSIINGARSASSPFEMLHFLRESIEAIKPEIVLFGFWDGLEMRNARLGKYSCTVAEGAFKHGFGVLERGTIVPVPNFPMVRKYNDGVLQKNEAAAKERVHETQEGVFQGFRHLCEKHGAAFAVACLNNGSGFHGFLHRNRFNWCFAENDWVNEREKWLLAPFDSHPNAASNVVYADVIEAAIKDIQEKGTCSPELSKITIRDTGSLGPDDQFIYPHY